MSEDSDTPAGAGPTPGPSTSPPPGSATGLGARQQSAGKLEAGQQYGAGQQAAATAAQKMTPEEQAIWDIDFGVKKSIRYHARRRAFYDRLENWTKILVAVSGAAAFATLIGNPDHWFPKIATAFVAAFGLADVVLNFGARARLHEELYRKFSELAVEIATTSRAAAVDVAKFRALRLTLETSEPPIIDALERECWNAEAESRGTDPQYLQELSRLQKFRAGLS